MTWTALSVIYFLVAATMLIWGMHLRRVARTHDIHVRRSRIALAALGWPVYLVVTGSVERMENIYRMRFGRWPSEDAT